MGDGIESTGDVVVMLLLFYGLPLAVVCVPTLLTVWFITRALRRRRESEGAARSQARLAGWWFAGAALLPVVLFNLTVGMPSWLVVLLGSWSAESPQELRYALFAIGASVAPVLAAWLAGARLGPGIARGDTTARAAAGRGMLVGLSALLALGLMLWLDVFTSDYDGAIETSSARGFALVQGLLLVLALPVLALGALAGWGLRRLGRRSADAGATSTHPAATAPTVRSG